MRKFWVLFLLAFAVQGQSPLDTSKVYTEKLPWDSPRFFDNNYQYSRFQSHGIDALEMEWFEEKAKLKKSLPDKSNWAEELEFQYWHLIFAYPVERGNADQKLRRLQSLPTDITKPFQAALLQDEKYLQSRAFRNLLPYYITYENSKARGFEKYSNGLEMANDKVEYIEKHFKGKIRDYALARILLDQQKYIHAAVAKRWVERIEDKDIKAQFGEKYFAQFTALKQEVILPELSFVDMAGNAKSLADFKGKVVYIDFWASWCGPCKVQFPFAKKLHEQLKGKDIVFLYLSLDDTVERWKEGIEDNGLGSFANGYLEQGWKTPFLVQRGVNGIPRYMILDKEGKLVDENAKRPNDADLLPVLLKYIGEGK